MHHDPVLERLFARVVADYTEFHFYAWDDEREEVVGAGDAILAAWDGDIRASSTGGATPLSKPGSPSALLRRPSSVRCRF